MSIEHVNLKEKLYQVRLSFDTQLAEVLQKRPDLTQAQIKQEFGVSDSVIRRVMKQFNIRPRKGGRKPKQQVPTTECPLISGWRTRA
jgi:hypothetical protein